MVAGEPLISSGIHYFLMPSSDILSYRQSPLGEILGTTAFSKGPLRDASFLVGADANTDDRYSSAHKRSLVAGLQFAFNLPYKGFLNVSPLYYKEADRNAYVRCDVTGGIPGESCLTDGNVAYRATWAVETWYDMDLGFLPARLQYFSVRGRINFYGPKGGENSPLPSTPTRLEIDSEPIRLSFDVGKAFWGSERTHKLDLWVAYRYWRNKWAARRKQNKACSQNPAGAKDLETSLLRNLGPVLGTRLKDS